ncbi:patatin-like protein 2 [Dorcoceras hygrometricum]|uniref:Patatin-like protein 2 n=1 Tax=Dorcoceras hygrometricum TaxID=472368 RepID=A0A2Z7DC25_9LAMI|nr:patatin-like protein 2 [Dorcoceras hygrometricum]
MVNMFKALESTGLRGFLGCSSVLYEQELEQFFDTALVQDNDITCVISGKYVAISKDRQGLLFSKSEKPVQYSCKKRLLRYEFRLLNDILAKLITVKAGSFDAVTHERFLMMTDIHFGVKINWSKILFEVLKEMADRTIKRAKGFAAQICVLLKGEPVVSLGEAKTFPPLKILSEKTINTYVATNKTIDARGESDEPHVDKVVTVKRKSVSKKKSAPTDKKDADEEPVEVAEKAVSKKLSASTCDEPVVTKKKRTTKKEADLSKENLELVSVATEAIPLQIIEPISVVNLPTRTGSDDDNVEREPVRLLIETEEMFVETDAGKLDETAEATGTDVVMGKVDIEEPVVQRSDETSTEESANLWREQVIDEVSAFFNSFSLRRLTVLTSHTDIAVKEEKVLTWAEIDSVQISLQRRLYIVAKYRELLLRKFLESHRANFSFGQPWSAMELQIIDYYPLPIILQ